MQAVHKVVYIFLCNSVSKEKGQRNESRKFPLENFWQGKNKTFVYYEKNLH